MLFYADFSLINARFSVKNICLCAKTVNNNEQQPRYKKKNHFFKNTKANTFRTWELRGILMQQAIHKKQITDYDMHNQRI